MRKKDVVLMATVTSFESLPHPSRSELRQFAELFSPLFAASSDESRRDAVAALSQCETVPAAVAFFIASQPIAVAAPFLAASNCLTDEALIAIARTQGEAHARAIVRREALSPTVIDALVGLRHDRTIRRAEPVPAQEPAIAPPTQAPPTQAPPIQTMIDEAERLAREDLLRQRLKALAGHIDRPDEDRLGLRNLSPIQEALLVRFARNRETGLFATTLADTLSASHWLSERIMLDISGQQLATTLKGLGMNTGDALFVLQRLYDHLASQHGGMARAALLWNALDANECGKRIEAWRRADSYTHAGPRRDDLQPQPVPVAANRSVDPRERPVPTISTPTISTPTTGMPMIRTTASVRRPALHRLR